ncbi:MAG: hypothetical protein MUC41_17600 [Syntrophobacteraceae bacterium]|jgi:hypothetical protein|nr:hypothetical protein [Syntrophobacteraceae bacterium]
MNQNHFLKQMIDFNRTAFDNAFSTMKMLQEQAEMAASGCLDQAAWLPKAGRTVVNEWMNVCKNGRESFKGSMDEAFNKVEALLVHGPKGE